MGEVSVILFGSAARGDTTEDSDVDILIVSTEGFPNSMRYGRLEVQMNTRQAMIKKARLGDLFAIHIALEGIAISDSSNFLSTFRESLKIKESYSKEREIAFALAAYLLRVGPDADQLLRAKRMAWCVRTVLISKLVESGRYIFSPNGLISAFPDLDVAPLISLRRNSKNEDIEKNIWRMEEFLRSMGGSSFLDLDMSTLKIRISSFGKSTALSTMKALEGASQFDLY